MTNIVNDIMDFVSFTARSNPLISYVGLAIFAFLIWRRPKLVLIVVSIALLIAGVVYIIMDAASSGTSSKQRMIHQGTPVENIFKLPGVGP